MFEGIPPGHDPGWRGGGGEMCCRIPAQPCFRDLLVAASVSSLEETVCLIRMYDLLGSLNQGFL